VNDTDSLIGYITECRESGVTILPPDINESAKAFTIVDGKIRYGLLGIKGVGEAALDSILSAREECGGFSSFTHFCSLVDSRKVNKKVVESLIKAGAFDSTGLKRSQLFTLVQDKWDRLSKKNDRNSLQMDIFGSNDFAPKEEEIPDGEELDYAEILKGEKEALGFYFSQHPLSSYEHIISRITPMDTASVKEAEASEEVTIVGIVNGIKEITTKRGDRMANVKLEDRAGMIEVIIFPDLLSKNRDVIKSDKPLVVNGTLEKTEDGTGRIRAKGIALLEDIRCELEKTVRIRIDCRIFKKDQLRKLRDILLSIKGDSRVRLEFRQNGDLRIFDVPDVRIDAGKIEVVQKHFSTGINIEVAKG
jgi:DNA polymerase-3 subunit alpha